MRKLLAGAALAALCGLAATSSFAGTPRTAAGDWNDDVGFPDASQQTVDQNLAVTDLQARSGGYGPSRYTTTVNDYGNQYSTTTYNGPSTTNNSGATNMNNVVSNSSSISDSAGAYVSVSTGQASGTSTQGAASKVVDGNNSGNITR
ncbi:MAG: hypothetical protein P4M11_01300 [Candidatus Pacebacteria bacterium]|nr:hypothetical protein [Candidatus Paceibacterota bacterium]